MKKLALATALVVTLSGCAISRGTQMSDAQINSIQRNVTTETQIRQMFGEPVAVSRDSRTANKVITFEYKKQDINREMAAVGGGLLGGLLGHQIGGGSGQVIARGVGAAGGALVGGNVAVNREVNQTLTVYIDGSGRVSDYRVSENASRSQSVGFGGGVGGI